MLLTECRSSVVTDAPAERAVSDQEFAELMAPFEPVGPVAVGVSGGGDSVALLRLLAPWADRRGVPVTVLTVDHGLRPESAVEAEWAARLAGTLDLPHRTLRWEGAKPDANRMAAAREARLSLLREVTAALGSGAVLALAHTLDDQAETVLLNLARGSGVDGLSAMEARGADGLTIRPLLSISRERLRVTLRTLGQGWLEDPSNEDRRYDRIKMRDALRQLAPLGVTAERLAQTATAMRRARAVLEAETLALAQEAAELAPLGTIRLDAARLAAAPDELALRLLRLTLAEVSGAAYPPALAPLEALLAWVRSGAVEGRTLHGCRIVRSTRLGEAATVIVFREPAAAERSGAVSADAATWDNRYRLISTWPDFDIARALGEEGAALLRQARREGWQPGSTWDQAIAEQHRGALSLWQRGCAGGTYRLVAVPDAGFGTSETDCWAKRYRKHRDAALVSTLSTKRGSSVPC
ncbi:MAG: tRNA lysidine(34) synthetase TilS [Pseudomonadota bacterium]